MSPRAALAGAANILRFDPDGWLADNTDGIGLVRDIELNAHWPLAGQRVLLVGAGGAAAGVLGPLLQARPRELVVVNRSGPSARRCWSSATVGWRATKASSWPRRRSEQPGEGFDVVINATASSLQAAAVPVPSRCSNRARWRWT